MQSIAKCPDNTFRQIKAVLCDIDDTLSWKGKLPAVAYMALENLQLLDEEGIVDHARDVAGPYLAEKWAELGDHPLVGEARIIGMMGALELTPDKASRAAFKTDAGTVGLRCRERCFANGLVMRHVRDTMIISPPLIMTKADIDTFADRAARALDETLAGLKSDGLMQ